jgi:hypothetical protein
MEWHIEAWGNLLEIGHLEDRTGWITRKCIVRTGSGWIWLRIVLQGWDLALQVLSFHMFLPESQEMNRKTDKNLITYKKTLDPV